MDIDVLAIAAVAITVVLFVLLSYLGRKSIYVPVQRGNHSGQRKTAGIQAGSQ